MKWDSYKILIPKRESIGHTHRFPLKTCGNDNSNLKLIFLVTLGILIINSSSISAQTKSLYYQSYVYNSVNSDSISIPSEFQAIPKINVGDIGGQLFLGLVSGTILSIGGAFVGTKLASSKAMVPIEGIIGLLAGYTIGVPIGVYAAASSRKYDPDLKTLIGSSIAGEIAGIFLIYLSNKQGSNDQDDWLILSPLVFPPIFSIVTLNYFQRKKTNIRIGFDVQQLPQPEVYSYGVKLQYQF